MKEHAKPAAILIVLMSILAALEGCQTFDTRGKEKSNPEVVASTTFKTPDGLVLTAQMICQRFPPIRLSKKATTPEYGRTPEQPVQVAGIEAERNSFRSCRYLNSLRGPDGQTITYDRLGSCCMFEIPGRSIGGMLDIYEIGWEGAKSPIKLYLDFYRTGELMIPLGLSAGDE